MLLNGGRNYYGSLFIGFFFSVIVSVLFLRSYVVIVPESLSPLAFIFATLLEAVILRERLNQSTEDGYFNNYYNVTPRPFADTDAEKYKCSMKWLLRLKMIILPLYLIFVLYFAPPIMYFSFLLYLLPFFVTVIFVKAERRRKDKQRNN